MSNVDKPQHPPNVRKRLAVDAAEDYELIRKSLREVLSMETERRASCPECSASVVVRFPDATARARVVEIWLNQGFGKTGEEEVEPAAAPKSITELEAMTSEQRMAWLRAMEAELATREPHEVTTVQGAVLVNGDALDAETAERIRACLDGPRRQVLGVFGETSQTSARSADGSG